jgi:hypothetical protein
MWIRTWDTSKKYLMPKINSAARNVGDAFITLLRIQTTFITLLNPNNVIGTAVQHDVLQHYKFVSNLTILRKSRKPLDVNVIGQVEVKYVQSTARHAIHLQFDIIAVSALGVRSWKISKISRSLVGWPIYYHELLCAPKDPPGGLWPILLMCKPRQP